jgi:hypothetical protein
VFSLTYDLDTGISENTFKFFSGGTRLFSDSLLGKKSPNETPGALLNRSVQISKIWEQLLERTSKQNNEVINNSLAIIKTIIEKGIVASDEKPIKEAVETIKEQNPVILDHVHDVIKSTVSGTMANLLYNCVFRAIPSTHSDSFRPPIPFDSVH